MASLTLHCARLGLCVCRCAIADSMYRKLDDVVLLKYNSAESISTAESTAREAHITATQRLYSLAYLEVCPENAGYPLILSLILIHALLISPTLFILPLFIISTVRDITAEKLQLQMSLCWCIFHAFYYTQLRTAESHVSYEIAQPRDIATLDNFSGDNFCMGLITRQLIRHWIRCRKYSDRAGAGCPHLFPLCPGKLL